MKEKPKDFMSWNSLHQRPRCYSNSLTRDNCLVRSVRFRWHSKELAKKSRSTTTKHCDKTEWTRSMHPSTKLYIMLFNMTTRLARSGEGTHQYGESDQAQSGRREKRLPLHHIHQPCLICSSGQKCSSAAHPCRRTQPLSLPASPSVVRTTNMKQRHTKHSQTSTHHEAPSPTWSIQSW